MNRKSMKEQFPREFNRHEEHEFVNPLRVFENYYFHSNNSEDYRKDAINRCLEEKLSFTSTDNNIANLVRMLFTPKCPTCNKEMTGCKAGGNCEIMTVSFKCECGCEIDITVPHDSIEVKLKK